MPPQEFGEPSAKPLLLPDNWSLGQFYPLSLGVVFPAFALCQGWAEARGAKGWMGKGFKI